MVKKNKLAIFIIGFVLLAGIAVSAALTIAPEKIAIQTAKTKISPVIQQHNNYFIYKGQTGKDALTLLKQHASMEQNHSGLVIMIDGRKADDRKHEYWAFYVNDKYAQVGPAAYQTKDGDTIEWKIEKY